MGEFVKRKKHAVFMVWLCIILVILIAVLNRWHMAQHAVLHRGGICSALHVTRGYTSLL